MSSQSPPGIPNTFEAVGKLWAVNTGAQTRRFLGSCFMYREPYTAITATAALSGQQGETLLAQFPARNQPNFRISRTAKTRPQPEISVLTLESTGGGNETTDELVFRNVFNVVRDVTDGRRATLSGLEVVAVGYDAHGGAHGVDESHSDGRVLRGHIQRPLGHTPACSQYSQATEHLIEVSFAIPDTFRGSPLYLHDPNQLSDGPMLVGVCEGTRYERFRSIEITPNDDGTESRAEPTGWLPYGVVRLLAPSLTAE